jgi:hypothetical protein
VNFTTTYPNIFNRISSFPGEFGTGSRMGFLLLLGCLGHLQRFGKLSGDGPRDERQNSLRAEPMQPSIVLTWKYERYILERPYMRISPGSDWLCPVLLESACALRQQNSSAELSAANFSGRFQPEQVNTGAGLSPRSERENRNHVEPRDHDAG